MPLSKMLKESSEISICKMLSFSDVVIPLTFSSAKIRVPESKTYGDCSESLHFLTFINISKSGNQMKYFHILAI